MKFKKSQSGRSMVEMLGVLAIIGVLYVGGIAGYSLSMRRHRANVIVDYASKFSIMLYSQCQQQILNGITNEDLTCNMVGTNSWIDDTDSPHVEIGPIPSGLKYMILLNIDSSDIVDIDTSFYDKKLCQAVASVVGSSCNSRESTHTTRIKIKQN